ncbi:nrk1 [Hemileuca sp. nucleopolyhedrovirus]|uniref:Nrk1 n=1 Tax=Hemileuca sp. nucleopolyhedrovirus TaxID=1367203 RepID=S5MQH2_9ABAC|nr:nrk1 [Hemileuca sp. nucleopolyhedrovirus]AGR56854.1 nrk1 [Hemileuca sp. nucleopolyhedrovirus]
MSHLLALGGVACTTKTTLLKKLKTFNNVVVHLDDLKEIHNRYNFDRRIGELLFAAYRTKDTGSYMRDYKNVHIFDRQPVESVVYSVIYQKMTDDESLKAIEVCKKMGLCDNWMSFVFVPADNSQDTLLLKMKQRANQLDMETIEYIEQQTKYFHIWSNVMGFEEITVDWNADINEQQNKILQTIHETIYKWTDDYADSGLYMYSFKIPIIKNKIAGFDLDGTLIDAIEKDIEVGDTAVRDWKLKYSDIEERFVKLLDDDFTLVVMCDLSAAYNDKLLVTDFKKKIEEVCSEIGLPMIVIVATKHEDDDRKLMTKMFDHLKKISSGAIDLDRSFFCGNSNDGAFYNDLQFAKDYGIKFIHDSDFFKQKTKRLL